MNWPTHLFSYSKTRQRKRLALNAWTNRALASGFRFASTGHPWLWLGRSLADQNLHLQHVLHVQGIEAAGPVDHWVPLWSSMQLA